MQGKLLVIDDDEASCRLVKAIFEAEPLDVAAAHAGSPGVARAIADRPDVILLDLHLPDCDGLEVLERILAEAPSLPVIMLTAHPLPRHTLHRGSEHRAAPTGAPDRSRSAPPARRHTWPGNVRELRNLIRCAVLQTNDLVIRREVVKALVGKTSVAPASMPKKSERSLREIADEAAKAAERQVICETLRTTQGNKSQAAKALRTDYKTLHLKMKHLGIRARDFSV